MQTLNSLGGPGNQNLYIAVEALDVVRGNGVEFEVFHWKGKSDRMFTTAVDDWAVFVCFGLLLLLICAGAALCVVWCIASKGDDEFHADYNSQTALQRQRADQEAEEKARKLYGDDFRMSAISSQQQQQQQQQQAQQRQSQLQLQQKRAQTILGGGTFSSMNSGGSFQQQQRHNTFAHGQTDVYTMDANTVESDGGHRGRLMSATSFHSGAHDAQW